MLVTVQVAGHSTVIVAPEARTVGPTFEDLVVRAAGITVASSPIMDRAVRRSMVIADREPRIARRLLTPSVDRVEWAGDMVSQLTVRGNRRLLIALRSVLSTVALPTADPA